MKSFFLFILSLVVLAETVVPCCLWDNCSDEEVASSQEADKKQKADCSPFAACATCTAVAEISKPHFPVIPLHSSILKHTAFNRFFIYTTFQPSFLQPPRLS